MKNKETIIYLLEEELNRIYCLKMRDRQRGRSKEAAQEEKNKCLKSRMGS